MSTEDILPFCFNPFSFDIDGMGLSEILGKMADSDEWHDGDFVCHCAVCQLLGPMARELERKAEQYDRLVADLYKHTEDSPDEYLAEFLSGYLGEEGWPPATAGKVYGEIYGSDAMIMRIHHGEAGRNR
jgi:hypothetical protein